jgi:hypothetical protein
MKRRSYGKARAGESPCAAQESTRQSKAAKVPPGKNGEGLSMTLRPVGAAGAAIIILTAGLAGCGGPQDVILRGNADSVDILYDGDIAGAQRLARQHCAQFERLPQQRQTKDNVVTYQCVVP